MVDVGTPARNGRSGAGEDDWPAQTADTIERVVTTVRDRTTGPALTISRALVYGTFAAIVATATLVVAIVMAVRLMDNYLPDSVFGESHTWAAHLIVGVVLTVAGLFLWSRRRVEDSDTG